MDDTRPTLPQRVTAVLHARQYIVFFAIGLYALDFAVPIVSAWMHRRGPFAELLHNSGGRSADAVARAALSSAPSSSRTCSSALAARRLHPLAGGTPSPASGDRRQFLQPARLRARPGGRRARSRRARSCSAATTVLVQRIASLGLLAFYLVVLYADYIIVLADVGPLRADRALVAHGAAATILRRRCSCWSSPCSASWPRAPRPERHRGPRARAAHDARALRAHGRRALRRRRRAGRALPQRRGVGAAERAGGSRTPSELTLGRRASCPPTPTRWCSAACSRCRRPRG